MTWERLTIRLYSVSNEIFSEIIIHLVHKIKYNYKYIIGYNDSSEEKYYFKK